MMTAVRLRLVVAVAALGLTPAYVIAQEGASPVVQRPVAARRAAPAQPVPAIAPEAPDAPLPAVDFDAEQTRRELSEILDKYPPALGRVLKLDPTLMSSEAYLASYPTLATFLATHPEVSRSPSFYLERVWSGNESDWTRDKDAARRRDYAEILAGAAAFLGFLVAAGLVVWVVRTMVDYRRWNRVSKTQFDVHTKLLDRMTTNEELLAYIQTPVGRRFLESGPAPLAGDPQPMSAPFSRILWSVQLGIVLVAAGIGLLVMSHRLDQEFSMFFLMCGGGSLAFGLGFIASGAAAYVLSRRMGLVQRHDVDQS